MPPIAQILLKIGMLNPLPSVDPAHLSTLGDLVFALSRNLPLIVGFAFHGV